MNCGISAIVAVIERNGAVLVRQKHEEPNHVFDGAWHIPGGKVERNEADTQALLREMIEETGLSISVRRFLGSKTDTMSGTVSDGTYVLPYPGKPEPEAILRKSGSYRERPSATPVIRKRSLSGRRK